jgi:hypothetical protein
MAHTFINDSLQELAVGIEMEITITFLCLATTTDIKNS